MALTATRDLAWIEPHVREDVLKRVARGKVQVTISLAKKEGATEALIDRKRAAEYLKAMQSLQKVLGISGEPSIETILSAPGVMRSCEESMRDILPVVRNALSSALDTLLAMRAREGDHLKRELKRCMGRMNTALKRLRPLASRVPVSHRKALMKRLEAAGIPVNLADARIVTEVALFAERCDITEELARIESHLAQFAETLEEDGPVGRKLEFLVQEMGREWNTTGAKANDASISRLVVAAKAELDRLREQLANIE